jgi:hypothetical protein
MTIGSDLDAALAAQSAAVAAQSARIDALAASVSALSGKVDALGTTPPVTPPVVPPVVPPVATPAGVTNATPFTGLWKTKTPATIASNAAKTSAFRSYVCNVWVNCQSYSVPVFVATTADPLVTITQPYGRPSVTAHVPATAVPAAGTDSNMAIIQPDGTTVDIWTAKWTNATTIASGRVNQTSLSGSGFGPQAGIRASGANTLGGLIRIEDITAGVIGHALAMAVPSPMLYWDGVSHYADYTPDGYGTVKGYVPPATEEDYTAEYAYKGVVPMGSRVVLPRSVSIDSLGLNASERMIAVALQEYGAYILDSTGTGGSISFYAETAVNTQQNAWLTAAYGTSWGAQGLNKIRQNLVITA